MKACRYLPLTLLALAAAAAADPPNVEVRCMDGSRFKGSLLEIGPDRARIESDFLTEPVPLKLNRILEISLPTKRGEFKGDHIATAVLSNGDVLRGELTGVTDKEILLRTWYAGDMVLRRSMVDTLDIQDRPTILYSGPTGLDGWTLEKKEGWAYENGVLRSKQAGSISRKLELPTKARFAFDVSWRSSPGFRFLFFCENAESKESGDCYMFRFVNSRVVELRKRVRNGSISIGIGQPITDLMSREKARFELLVDRKTGLIQLRVNNRAVVEWTDPEPQAGHMGGGIFFDSADSTPLRFSRIDVSSWDGVLESRADQQEDPMLDDEDGSSDKKKDEPEPDPKRVRLRNNDHVEGEMAGIENGKVKLKTKFGDMNLPVSRLRSFPLRTRKEKEDWKLGLYEEPKRRNGDIRAWFADGSHVTFRLDGAGDGHLKGYSQTFGDVEFDASAFCRIEFNLYPQDGKRPVVEEE